MIDGDPTAFEKDAPAEEAPLDAGEEEVVLPTLEEIEAGVSADDSADAPSANDPPKADARPADDVGLQERARKLGWKSADEWRGDPPPGGHKTASEFLETNAALRRELDLVRTESVEATRRSVEVAQAAMQRQLEKERQEIEAYYSAKREAAIKRGDVKAVDAVDDERAKELAALQPKSVDPWVTELEAKNKDIVDNPMTFGALQGVYSDLSTRVARGEYPEIKTKKDLVEASLWLVRQRFGGETQPPAPANQQPAPTVPNAVGVDAGGRGVSGAASKGYNDLPAEGKTTFKMLSKSGAYTDDPKGRAEYAKDYWSE